MMASKQLLEQLVRDFTAVSVTRAVILPGDVQTQSQTLPMAQGLQSRQASVKTS